jgi:helix-turn-helix protein
MAVADQFGANLALCRKRAKLSQEELAVMASLHRTAVGQIERGERVCPCGHAGQARRLAGYPTWPPARRDGLGTRRNAPRQVHGGGRGLMAKETKYQTSSNQAGNKPSASPKHLSQRNEAENGDLRRGVPWGPSEPPRNLNPNSTTHYAPKRVFVLGPKLRGGPPGCPGGRFWHGFAVRRPPMDARLRVRV